jgi:hypothetical protein
MPEVCLHRFACLIALVASLGSSSAAAGVGLRWNSCAGESNRNFACDRSSGAELLVGSFQSPAGMSMIFADAYVRVTVAEGDIPSWWRMWAAMDCRRSSTSLSVDMSTESECDDPWQGGAYGLFEPNAIDERGVELWISMGITESDPVEISPGRTYGLFRWTIQRTRSEGPGSCAGCSTPTCIVLEEVVLSPLLGPPVEITDGITGLGGAGNIVTWQGGTPSCRSGAPKGSSWGELKRRYR